MHDVAFLVGKEEGTRGKKRRRLEKSWGRHTDVLVLNVASGLAFHFCLGMRLLSEMLDEHFLRENAVLAGRDGKYGAKDDIQRPR